MKKSMKVFSVLLIIFAMIFISVPVFANPDVPMPPSAVVHPDPRGTDSLVAIGDKILGVVSVVGTIVAVAILIVLGIKYMMGSAEEKAEYKKTLFPYFIGAILIFAATQLADVVYKWAITIK